MKQQRSVFRRIRPVGRVIAALILILLAALVSIEIQLLSTARGQTYHEVAAVPARRVAIVFGAQVLPGGQLSVALAHRVDAAVALYRAGKVRQLLMTGDNREGDYDEPDAMRAYAIARGVPEGAILTDPAGLRTYDSCYRARGVFGIGPDEAILVTQAYHLPRAIFTCGGVGVRAIGFVADPFGGPRGREAELREHPARWLAWWQVVFERPLPPTTR
jgi:SanA protein